MNAVCLKTTAILRTPIGPVDVTACKTGVHAIRLTGATELLDPENVAVLITKQPDDWPTPLTQCVDWLMVYFKDARAAYQKPLPPLHRPSAKTESFTYKVWETLTKQVPCGETVTYSQLAGMAENPKACRAVGGAMRTNPVAILVPCHRVMTRSGDLNKYMWGEGTVLKKWLLEHEGAKVK